jgi:hypothetical protein
MTAHLSFKKAGKYSNEFKLLQEPGLSKFFNLGPDDDK